MSHCFAPAHLAFESTDTFKARKCNDTQEVCNHKPKCVPNNKTSDIVRIVIKQKKIKSITAKQETSKTLELKNKSKKIRKKKAKKLLKDFLQVLGNTTNSENSSDSYNSDEDMGEKKTHPASSKKTKTDSESGSKKDLKSTNQISTNVNDLPSDEAESFQCKINREFEKS